MIKKMLAVLFASMLVLAFVACGGDDNGKKEGSAIVWGDFAANTDAQFTITITAGADLADESSNQDIEYSYSTSDTTAPTANWKTGGTYPLAFNSVPAGTYYIWARSKAGGNYLAGAAEVFDSTTYVVAKGESNSVPIITESGLDLRIEGGNVTFNWNYVGTDMQSDALPEYALGSDTAPTTDWQTEVTFAVASLTPDTIYHLWARKRETETLKAGTPVASVATVTTPPAGP
jgi:hypothetical protein